MKKCPYCAEEIQDHAIKCKHCGEWLDKKEEPTLNKDVLNGKVSTPQESSPPATLVKPKIKTEKLYEAYLGETNRFYYVNKFSEFDRQPEEIKASWNWAAFFGNWVWALYRKMYGCFFAFLGISLIESFLSKEGFAVISIPFLLITCIAFGMFANLLYYRNVKKKIADAQLLISDESRLLEFLRNKGGVHTWVIWLCIGIWVIVLLFWSVVSIISLFSKEVNYAALIILFVSLISGVPIIAILYANINNEWKMKLQDIWDNYWTYIIAIPIFIVVAGIIFTLSQTPNENLTSEDWINKAIALRGEYGWRNSDQAIEYLNKAIKLQPDSAKAFNIRGDVYSDLEKYDLKRAIEDYSEAIRLKPNYSFRYYEDRANAYYLLKNYDLACSDYQEACALGYCGTLRKLEREGICR